MQGVFFDLDGTLLDEDAIKGLSTIFFEHFRSSLLEIPAKNFFLAFKKTNQSLYEDLLRGNISGKELLSQRFQRTLEELNILNREDLAKDMQKKWDNLYYSHYALYEQTIPMLEFLVKKGKILAIITNGLVDIQMKKIQKFPKLQQLVGTIIVSEEYGVSKPDPRIFRICLEQTAIANPSKVLYLGNTLETDIKGAEAARIQPVLFDPSDRYPFYLGKKIRSHLEILEFI